MRIITFKRILEFSEKYADAQKPLSFWYHTVKRQKWNSFNEVRLTFKSADYVGNNRYVFNIKGNTYRLVAIISFNAKKVYIRFIGTHADYDKIKDIKNI